MSSGTYVALKLSPESQSALAEFSRNNGISLPPKIALEGYHTTVLYSTVYCPDIEVDPNQVYTATFSGFDLFDPSPKLQASGNSSAILVVRLEAPEVVERHNYFKDEHSANHGHPQFNPHISICYNYSGDINSLPPITFPITLTGEYAEDLNLTW